MVMEQEKKNNIYLLKDISHMSGFSTHTLNYYLKKGLISAIGLSPYTNFRYFDDTTLETLVRIRAWRKSGLSLKKIHRLITAGREAI